MSKAGYDASDFFGATHHSPPARTYRRIEKDDTGRFILVGAQAPEPTVALGVDLAAGDGSVVTVTQASTTGRLHPLLCDCPDCKSKRKRAAPRGKII